MPYYRCDNFGKCDIADTGEPIELPPGAEPICPEPTCHEPLSPAGNSSEDPVFLASLGTPDQGGRRLFYPIALFIGGRIADGIEQKHAQRDIEAKHHR